jgi:hypothetical protein
MQENSWEGKAIYGILVQICCLERFFNTYTCKKANGLIGLMLIKELDKDMEYICIRMTIKRSMN